MQHKWAVGALAVALLAIYNAAQPDLVRMRTQGHDKADSLRREAQRLRAKPTDEVIKQEKRIVALDQQARLYQRQAYGPSMGWLDRLANANKDESYVKLDFNVLSSMMVAGLASGFKSQVANLLWMKSDEYWHKGLLTRQVPLMEAVVTLDPQFIDAWSTAGWHWAYNIYADIELDPRYKQMPKVKARSEIYQRQDTAINIGLDYLSRGAQMNPDTYRLWFENAWTRAYKAGYLDEQTIYLMRQARLQPDARNIQRDYVENGKEVKKTEAGLDVVGRTIGHVYEGIPDIDKALDHYGRELLRASAQERAMLDANGQYWARYGTDYTLIAQLYNEGDATLKAQIKQLVPDIERLVAAVKVRNTLSGRDDGGGSQPTGAYVSIAARYLPAYKLMKAGRYQDAINQMIGVMNANQKQHLQGLPVLSKVLTLRGDAPAAIQKQLDNARRIERESSQDIGLHLLGVLYGKLEEQTQGADAKKAVARLAHQTWVRSRERDTLDFYAKRKVRSYQAKYGFSDDDPDVVRIAQEIKASRKGGVPQAAPEAAPNVGKYYGDGHEGHDHEGDAHEGHDHGHEHGSDAGRETTGDLFQNLDKQGR